MQSSQLMIRMLRELIRYSNKIKKTQEDMKVTLSEIKKNLLGTSNGGDEAGIQINNLEQIEEINIQTEQKEEIRIKKKKTMRVLETYGMTLNVPMSKS